MYGAYIYDQVNAIRRNSDYEVLIFKATTMRGMAEHYVYDGIKVFLFPSLFMPSYFFNGLTNDYNGRAFLRALRRLDINLEDIAVVHCHTASYACYASAIKRKCPGVRTVLQYHDPDPYQVRLGKFAKWKPNAVYRAKMLIEQFCNIDLHLCISKKVEYNLTHFPEPHVRECFESYRDILHVLRDVPAPRGLSTYVLYNGVDTSQFHRIEGLRDSSVFKIGCVANFIDWKDQMTLIRAVRELHERGVMHEMRVRLIGHGPMEGELRDYVEKNGLAGVVAFEQEVQHSELPAFYNSLDLFVLPSYFEGFGCVFTEAAACGVPFMGCVGQGYSEYIAAEDRGRWLIEPGDYEQLSRNIEGYMRNGYEQRLRETYDIDELVKRYLNYIEAL